MVLWVIGSIPYGGPNKIFIIPASAPQLGCVRPQHKTNGHLGYVWVMVVENTENEHPFIEELFIF